MMPLANLIQAFFSRNYYQYTVFTSETLTSVLSKIGASWLILNVKQGVEENSQKNPLGGVSRA